MYFLDYWLKYQHSVRSSLNKVDIPGRGRGVRYFNLLLDVPSFDFRAKPFWFAIGCITTEMLSKGPLIKTNILLRSRFQ